MNTSLASQFMPLQASHAGLLSHFAYSGFALTFSVRFVPLGFVLRTRNLGHFTLQALHLHFQSFRSLGLYACLALARYTLTKKVKKKCVSRLSID